MEEKPIPSADEGLSPIIFYYFDLNGSGAFCELLEERFRQTGSRRPIVFREWDCYEELPGEDGDLFAYDGIVLSALAAKGLLQPVPEEVSADGVFDWVMEKSKYRNRNFGVPIMMCSNALICRKRDDLHVRSIMELHETVAIPIRSMLMFYFLQTLCSNREVHRSMQVMEHLLDLLGGSEFLGRADQHDYDGPARFNRGECRYLLGFTEDLMHCEKDEYTVRFEDFSNSRKRRETLFMADFVSLAKRVPDEKRRDCIALMKIMADEQFTFDICTSDGRLQYLLPANKRLFPRLAALDPLYGRLCTPCWTPGTTVCSGTEDATTRISTGRRSFCFACCAKKPDGSSRTAAARPLLTGERSGGRSSGAICRASAVGEDRRPPCRICRWRICSADHAERKPLPIRGAVLKQQEISRLAAYLK
ncbi:MAG: hypothetical protein K6F56_02320 [Oscillospiraceae bacterium]|nr:hypothetical protein [Oscillospiraceae bacterium]